MSLNDKDTLNALKEFLILSIASICLTQIPILNTALSLIWLTPLHELGHALVYWYAGIFAVPTHLFVTIVPSGNFSWLMFFAGLFLHLFLIYKGISKERTWLVIVSSFLLLIQLILSFTVAKNTVFIIATFAGCLGELFIPLILVVYFFSSFDLSSYLSILDKKFLAVVGLFTFFSALFRWVGVAFAGRDLPLGSLLFGSNKGDMNDLINKYGFSEKSITVIYLLASICAVVVFIAILVNFYFFRRGVNKAGIVSIYTSK